MNERAMKLDVTAPLSDIDCERVVIGSSISTRGVVDEIREFLTPECFYDEQHKQIWCSMLRIIEKGDEPNLISVMADLKSKDSKITPFELANISQSFATGSIVPYALRLRDLNIRRCIRLLGLKMVQSGSTETEELNELRQRLREQIDGLFMQQDENIFTMNDIFSNLYEMININLTNQGLTGTPTGFRKIDAKGGLQKSNLIIVAGETSQGKTSFASSIVMEAIKNDRKVAFFTMEMTKEELTARFVAMNCGVSSSDILYSSTLTNEQLQSIDIGIGKIKGSNLFFDSRSTSNIETILTSIRSLKMKYDIDGAVIDYLQILNVNMNNSNKEQAMGDVARRLKNLAKDLNIWIIALSQLNRDSQNPVPNLNRLRDSGQIAEAADVVMLVYRPEYYHRSFPEPYQDEDTKGKAMIDIAKGRNIGTSRFICQFNSSTTHFKDLDNDVIPQEIYIDEQDSPF